MVKFLLFIYFFFQIKPFLKFLLQSEQKVCFILQINSQFKVTSSDFLIVLTVYYEIFFYLFNTLEASDSSLCIL